MSATLKALAAALLVAACVELPATFETNAVASTPSPRSRAGVHRGVSWVAGHEVIASDLDPLVSTGVDWIVQTPFGWQRSLDDPNVQLATSGRMLWGERDEGLIRTTRLAAQRGIRTMLKPHVWVGHGAFRGDIRMASDEDWDGWFASYERFILHYAKLASAEGIDALCIGTELRHAAIDHPERWRALIRDVREIYDGELTYAANWYEEFESIEFWDELDFIGIQAYFPLSQTDRPSVEELVEGWQRHLSSIRRVQARFNKRVVFTEIGYRSEPDAAIEPWRWPRRVAIADEVDFQTQARCYEAFFRVFWNRPWFAGAYFWKWYPNHRRTGGMREIDFTPQNKPAQEVLARWFGASGEDR